MTKTDNIFVLIILSALFAACQSEDNLPVQHPDGYGQIQFSVAAETLKSRADDIKRDNYDKDINPNTMGVYGYHNTFTPEHTIFSNVRTEYNEGWTYSDKKYWADYAQYNSFDFFAYMPHVKTAAENGPALTKADAKEEYTLSIPYTFDSPIIFDTKKAPLICNTPVHKSVVYEDIKFYMDQTLTGFNINFKLVEKMDNIRDLKINSVHLKGASSVFYTGGTLNRKYTWSGTSWTSDAIKWTNTTNPEADVDINIEYKNNDTTTPSNYSDAVSPETGGTLTLNTSYQKWGSNFYVIPSSADIFTPTIEVNYDIYVDGSETITRQNITSSITLNKTLFSSYTNSYTHKTGKIYPIQILIAPSYLYVLADEDQQAGVIVIK